MGTVFKSVLEMICDKKSVLAERSVPEIVEN